MNSPSRRMVLGSADVIGFGIFLEWSVPAQAAGGPGGGPAFDTALARSVLNRLLPGHAEQFQLSLVDRADTVDRFRVTGAIGRIQVPGCVVCRWALRQRAVKLSGSCERSSGVPAATMVRPAVPPPGPMSMT